MFADPDDRPVASGAPPPGSWEPPESEWKHAYPEVWGRVRTEDAKHDANLAELAAARAMFAEPRKKLNSTQDTVLDLMCDTVLRLDAQGTSAEARLVDSLPESFGRKLQARIREREM